MGASENPSHVPLELTNKASPLYHESARLCGILEGNLRAKWLPFDTIMAKDLLDTEIAKLNKNLNLQKDPNLQKVIQKHIYDFLERFSLLDTLQFDSYKFRRGNLEELRWNTEMQEKATKAKSSVDQVVIMDLFSRGLTSTLTRQLWLLDRAYQPRALEYDKANWSTLNRELSDIDEPGNIPTPKLIQDWILGRQESKPWSIKTDRNLFRDGALHLIDTLSPPESSWLKEMVKNGNITQNSRRKGFTDTRDGVDVVDLILRYKESVSKFQWVEQEIGNIRNIANSKKDEFLPTQSDIFTEIAPPAITVDYTMKMFEGARTDADVAKVCLRVMMMLVNAEEFVGVINGIDSNWKILRKWEQLTEWLSEWAKLIILTILCTKIFTLAFRGGKLLLQPTFKLIIEKLQPKIGANHMIISYAKRMAF